MSLRTRLFIDHPFVPESSITLNGYHSHYLSQVLRFEVNERLRVFNGKDGEWEAFVTSLSKKQVMIKITHELTPQVNEKPLHLAFSPIKNTPATFIVQKITELGVTDIWPIITKRTIIHKVNEEKLLISAIEAAEQSERLSIPKIHPIQKLSGFLKQKPFSGNLLFCYEAQAYSKPVLLKDKISLSDNCVLIGPEGGFAEEEAEYIKNLEYTKSISFGRRIMRVETALIAALGAYNTIMDNWV